MSTRVVSKTIDLKTPMEDVSEYITEINNNGIRIHPKNESGATEVQLDGAGMKVMDITNEENVAEFGSSGAQIGQTSGAHSIIDANGQRFYASDGTTQLANIGYGEGNTENSTQIAPYYTLGARKTTDTPYSPSRYNIGDMCVYDDKIYVCVEKIDTAEEWTPSHWRLLIGNYSYAEGNNVVACGTQSHAEGNNTIAVSTFAHAEGNNTIAYGLVSHAEGAGSYTMANAAHAEGWNTTASGRYSHAQNAGTRAVKDAQTTIGTFNEEDIATTTTHPSGTASYGQYAFIIGNGTSLSNRSNALTVDWDGNVKAAKDITDGYNFSIPFIAIMGITTFAEITAAINAGKMVFAKDTNNVFYTYVYTESSSKHWFFRSQANPIMPRNAFIVCHDDDSWDTSGKQTTRTLGLGGFYTVGTMSSAGTSLGFSIPTGRIFPSGTTISKITFTCVARAGSSNGTGKYIIKSASGGSAGQAFDSSTTTKFYNAADQQKSLTSSMWTTKTIDGQTNIRIFWDGDPNDANNYFFVGNSTNNGYCNNQPVAMYLSGINITFEVPA